MVLDETILSIALNKKIDIEDPEHDIRYEWHNKRLVIFLRRNAIASYNSILGPGDSDSLRTIYHTIFSWRLLGDEEPVAREFFSMVLRMSEDSPVSWYDLWAEGFIGYNTGSRAVYLGKGFGVSLPDACRWLSDHRKDLAGDFYMYDGYMTYSGQRVFDNERDARKLFG